MRPLLLTSWLAMIGLFLLESGCGPQYGIRKINDASWFRRETQSALDSSRISARTRRFLRVNALEDEYREDPEQLFRDLHERLLERRERKLACFLAEMLFLNARRYGFQPEQEFRWYLSSCEYSWAFLFDQELAGRADPYDPLFRLASDLYNRSLARTIPYFIEHRPLTRGQANFPLMVGEVHMVPELHEFRWDPGELDDILVCYDYEVYGMPGYARAYGIGCPIVAVREPKEMDVLRKEDQFLPTIHQSYPATVVIRFLGSILDRTQGAGGREALAEIYNTLRLEELEHQGHRVTLEADFTTPLAHLLQDAPDQSGLAYMLNPGSEEYPTQLVMLEHYQEDRIPVIFVHGLMSSPITWMPLFNDLITDPELRNRYQFWFFMYSTGNPIAYSASELRRALLAVQTAFDPEQKNANFQDSVLVGHSMGGLLSKLQVTASGTRLWDTLADTPFEEVEFDLEERSFLSDVLFFDPVPFLSRVVFMATPHRGSDIATSWIGRLGISLTALPNRLTTLRGRIAARLKDDPKYRMKDLTSDTLTGVSDLSPDDVFLVETSTWTLPEPLPVHSIMGNHLQAGVIGGTDSVVPYDSSHLDDVLSELVIHSTHNVQEHPEAINELRRILHLHLDEHDAKLARDATPTTDR